MNSSKKCKSCTTLWRVAYHSRDALVTHFCTTLTACGPGLEIIARIFSVSTYVEVTNVPVSCCVMLRCVASCCVMLRCVASCCVMLRYVELC